MKRHVVVYERDFRGYRNTEQDDLGNSNYSCDIRNIFPLDKISKDSLSRLARAFKKDHEERAYKSEGWFFTVVTDQELLQTYGCKFENGGYSYAS